MTSIPEPKLVPVANLGKIRFAIALLQAILLYALYRCGKLQLWPANHAELYLPAILLSVFIPILGILSVAQLQKRRLGYWLGAVVVVLTVLALHDWYRRNGLINDWSTADTSTTIAYPNPLLLFVCSVCLYVAQSLKLAYEHERKILSDYALYFDIAWKLLVQIKFSFIFVGAMFLILSTGAALFKLVHIDFLSDLLRNAWFNIPVATLAFGCALHLTDIRPAIVRGIRNLLLVLLSWLLPIASLIIAGFLLSLALTGLTTLWETRHASKLLLSCCALLIILINTAYQDGSADRGSPKLLEYCRRFASFLILPLASLACYALSLRIADYGWSADRVVAVTCAGIAMLYGAGYALSGFNLTSRWSQLSNINIIMAYLILATLFGLFTPVLDPARIAVNSQVERLYQGKLAANKLDYDYLRFEGGHYGKQALEKLAQEQQLTNAAQIRQYASTALALVSRDRTQTADSVAIRGYKVWPETSVLPASFLKSELKNQTGIGLQYEDHRCIAERKQNCDVFMLDINRDNKVEIIVLQESGGTAGSVYTETQPDQWRYLGSMPYGLKDCVSALEDMKKGLMKPVSSDYDDIVVHGLRLHFRPETSSGLDCKK